ncbi:hypothetical protein OGAPHI_001771 [Ogataea philodendri]|uniref:Regulator of rDNA transcription 14 n=1 Tax=Ogataea philodendri TaxID=1378263 RepID=A0A9P8P9Z0_9ASCO|nr:uncharacterized protein OGAPHI_001771 [Ogataea philodendri]KAH3668017.1 hypothetical protein OGAPHI_001771 [Ogataea philodendri]
MVQFVSDKTRARAKQGLDALLSKHLPGSESGDVKKEGAAAIAHAKREMNVLGAHRQAVGRERAKVGKRNNKAIRKSKALEDRVNKVARLQAGDSKEVEAAVAENVRRIKSWENTNSKEISELESKIMRMRNTEAARRKKVRLSKVKKDQFQKKIKKGLISVPGLTPGLAPVGESDSSDEEDVDLDQLREMDDYDEYN